MNRIALVALLMLSACGSPPPVVAPSCPTMPGFYYVDFVPLDAASEFCSPWSGEVDLTTADALQAQCEPGCACTSDLVTENETCGPRVVDITCSFVPWHCELDRLDENRLLGWCTSDWGAFKCRYDAFFDRAVR